MPLPVVLQVAVSVDGLIARPDGSVDWLVMPEGDEGAAMWNAFISRVKAIIMGRATFDMVLGFGWSYGDIPTWVYTTRPLPSPLPHPAIHATTKAPEDLVPEIRAAVRDSADEDGLIWLEGGGQIVAMYEAADRIDEWQLGIMPTRLGDGLPLWPGTLPQRDLSLVDVERHDGDWVMLTYRRRET